MRFLVLKNPDPQPAAMDEALTFTVEPVTGAPTGPVVRPVWLAGEGNPVLGSRGGREPATDWGNRHHRPCTGNRGLARHGTGPGRRRSELRLPH